MLIDTREPPRPPEPGDRAPVEPDWRLWGWLLASVGLLVLGAREDAPGVAVVLVLAALFAGVKAFDAFGGGNARGLRDWRQ